MWNLCLLQEQPAKPSFQFQVFGIFILIIMKIFSSVDTHHPDAALCLPVNPVWYLGSSRSWEPEAGSWPGLYSEALCQHLRDRGRRSLCIQGQPGLHRETLSQQNKITTKKSVPNKIEWEWGLLSRIFKTLRPVPSTGEWTSEWMNEVGCLNQ